MPGLAGGRRRTDQTEHDEWDQSGVELHPSKILALGYGCLMCRSIKTLRNAEEPPTQEEIEAAALQFVRKISGYRKPSAANKDVFDRAVDEVTAASARLLDDLVIRQPAPANA
jgi:hypothetical protein